jgi:hypothetical protein
MALNEQQKLLLMGNGTETDVENISNASSINAEQIAILQGNKTFVDESTSAPVQKEKGRMFAQGLTFGFADEIEGFLSSRINDGVTYEQARDEAREKIALYAQAHPGEALSLELAGSVAPTILSVFGGVPAWKASVGNLFRMSRSIFKSGSKGAKQSLGTSMNRAGISTGVYSVGVSDDELSLKDPGSILDMGKDFGQGYVLGAPIAGAFGLAGNVASKMSTGSIEGIADTVLNIFAKFDKKKNTKIEKGVRQELAKLESKTGLSNDEIIQEIANGGIISENISLNSYIKNLVADHGIAKKNLETTVKGAEKKINLQTGETISERIPGRPEITRTDLKDTMQKSIDRGGIEENLIQLYKKTDDEFTLDETAKYNSIFKDPKNNRELDGEMTDTLLESIRKFDGGADTINKMNAGSDIKKKLFYELDDDGLPVLTRQPTIHDAEIVYRSLRNEKDRLFRAGEKDLYQVAKSNMANLKSKLDKFTPELKAIRKGASDLRTTREAYIVGQRILGRNPLEVEDFVNEIKDVPGAMQSLRDGMLVSFQGNQTIGKIRELAEGDKNLNKILKMVFPEESLDTIITKANIAHKSAASAGVIPQISGSQTAYNTKELTKGVFGRTADGNTNLSALGIANKIYDYFTDRAISPEQAQEFVRIVTSSDPALVQKALIDDNAMRKLTQLMDNLIQGAAKSYGDVQAKVQGADIGKTLDPVGSSGIEGILGILGRKLTGSQP